MFVLISVLIQTLILSCQPVHPVPEKNTEAIPSGPVYQSKDGGQSWTGFGKGLPTDFVASDLAFFDGELYAGSELGIFHTSAGVAHSDWKKELLMQETNTRFYHTQKGLYASKYTEGLYQKMSAAGIWIPLHQNLKDKSVRALVGCDPDIILVGTETGIYRSPDAGKQWSRVMEKEIIHSLIKTPEAILASGDQGIYRSTDQGNTWTQIREFTSGTRLFQLSEDKILAHIQKPRKQKEMFDWMERDLFLVSEDGGLNWQKADFQISGETGINDLSVLGKYLFLSHKQGLSRSADQGKTWEKIELPKGMSQTFKIKVIGQSLFIIPTFGC